MLYAHIFPHHIHTVDLLTRRVRSQLLGDNFKVLTALNYAEQDFTFKQAIWRPGFLLYDSATQELVVLAASEHSRKLSLVKTIPFSLYGNEGLPRDV